MAQAISRLGIYGAVQMKREIAHQPSEIDQAIQAHGGAGVSDDAGLARDYASMRTMRLADGPDEVHNRAIARLELRKYANTSH